MRAPFLIHPTAPEVHQYDEDITVVLGDWYEKEHSVLAKKFLSVSNPTGAEPVPEAALVSLRFLLRPFLTFE
jgi:iron transport multicopper oxidase